MLEEEEYLRTLIDADVSTLNGMSAGAIQDALKLLEAAQEANRPDQDAILDAIDLFMEKEADPNKPLQRIPTDAATGIKPYGLLSVAMLPLLPSEARILTKDGVQRGDYTLVTHYRKIGRWTCRGRGCQYLSIAVVD